MNPQGILLAFQLLLGNADVTPQTFWGREFEAVQYNGDSYVAYRMHQPLDPIPVSKELGEFLRNDRALGIPEAWGGLCYGFQIWTDLGEVILYREDPYADVRPGLMDEMEQFEDEENADDCSGNQNRALQGRSREVLR